MSQSTEVRPLTGIERIGIPHPLRWGFVGVLIFMVGDGVETSFLSAYLADPAGGGLDGAQASFATVTLYGVAALIASWFSGTLSAIWGPRRVMWLGAGIWLVLEVVFLFVAIPAQNAALIITVYAVRGLAYPLFAFSFLVWIQTISKPRMRGSAAGWFWFAFTGGLPTSARGSPRSPSAPWGSASTARSSCRWSSSPSARRSAASRSPSRRACAPSPTPRPPTRRACGGSPRASTSSGATSGPSPASSCVW